MIDERITRLTRERYDRKASSYDCEMAIMERLAMRRWRELLWSKVPQPGEKSLRILEVGVGTGLNFRFYPEGAEVTAIDLSPKMIAKARSKAERDGVKVDLREMDVQRLDFPDNCFDVVVSTCVFCSVPDPILGLREVARVLKPDGKVLLLDHVRSETVFGVIMDLLNPLVVRLSGANINRRTVDNVKRAGLKIANVDSFFFDIVKLTQASK